MKRYRKLLSALLPIVVFGLVELGVDVPPGWSEGVISVLTPILVWAVPNA